MTRDRKFQKLGEKFPEGFKSDLFEAKKAGPVSESFQILSLLPS
jgi:hypothetical protein